MSRDCIIIASAWGITIILLFLFVPRNKIRHAILIFFFKQFITWILGLSVTELRLVEYPVRLFPCSTKTSFDFEYFIYPAICVLFNLHYPEKKNSLAQFRHYSYFCTIMTAIEVILEKYTDIIEYLHWTWYVTWITLFITFYMSRKFYVWYFKPEANQ